MRNKRLIYILLFFVFCLFLNIHLNRKIEVSFKSLSKKPLNYYLFFTSSKNKEFSYRNSLQQVCDKESNICTFKIPVYRLERLRINFGLNPGKVFVSQIKVSGNREQILNDFSKFQPINIKSYKSNGDNLEIFSNERDVQIIYTEPLHIYSKININIWGVVFSAIACFILYYGAKRYGNKVKLSKILKYFFLYTPIALLYLMHYKALFKKATAGYDFGVSYSLICDCLSKNSLVVIFFAILFGVFFGWRKFRIPSVCLISLLTLIIFIDYVVIYNLDARFIFSEIKTQGKAFDTAYEMLKTYAKTDLFILNILFIINIIFIFTYFKKISKKISLSFGIISCLALISIYIPWSKSLLAYKYYNVFDVNLKNHQGVKYSENFINKIQSSFDASQECVNGLNKRKNVILIIAESLSSYKIKNFNGLEDRMPKLDKISRKGLSFKNFYGNSYNTTGGIFSVLTGKNLIHGYHTLGDLSYEPYYNETIAKRLNRAGYLTEFFTAIDLQLGIDALVKYSDFTKVSSSSDPFYKGKERIIFNAVADNYLFDNVLKNVSTGKKEQPFLFVVSTISTHGPFIDPITRENSFDKTLTFLDNELDRFINNLKKINFFENGIVVITADHRVMLPISNDEYDRYGIMGDSAIPLIILCGDKQGKENFGVYSQSDIAPSLEYYLTKKGCFNKFQRNLFDDNYHKDVCLIHSYLSPLDKLMVYCSKDKYADIQLNGDKTSISNKDLSVYKDYVLYLRTQPMRKK